LMWPHFDERDGFELLASLHDPFRCRLHNYCVAYEPMCRLADQDLVRGGGLLETLRDVDGASRDDQMALQVVACHDLPAVDPDASLQPDAAVPLVLLVQARERVAHLRGSTDSTKRVVLVHDWDAEDSHHGVADELLDDATVSGDRGLHCPEVVGHEQAERLGL